MLSQIYNTKINKGKIMLIEVRVKNGTYLPEISFKEIYNGSHFNTFHIYSDIVFCIEELHGSIEQEGKFYEVIPNYKTNSTYKNSFVKITIFCGDIKQEIFFYNHLNKNICNVRFIHFNLYKYINRCAIEYVGSVIFDNLKMKILKEVSEKSKLIGISRFSDISEGTTFKKGDISLIYGGCKNIFILTYCANVDGTLYYDACQAVLNRRLKDISKD